MQDIALPFVRCKAQAGSGSHACILVINDQFSIRTMISIVLRIHISRLFELPALPPD
jgi:hypothetical protein